MRAVLAAVFAFGAIGLMLAPAYAQPNPPPALVTDLSPPGPEASLAAYNSVEEWVRAWGAPQNAPIAGLERMSGCAVTLRREGHVVGRGVTFGSGDAALIAATTSALAEAGQRLQVTEDALAHERRLALAKELGVSLELAGPLVPIAPATFAELDATLEPGLDGVAARVNGRTAGVFPSAMLTTNMTPSDSMIAAISQASGDPTLAVRTDPKGQPAELAKSHNVACYKFRTTHVAPSGPHRAPTFLFRGGKVVESRTITAESLENFANDLASNLRARMTRQGETITMLGSLLPFQGRAETESATPLERLLTVAALSPRLARQSGRGPTFNAAVHDLHLLRASVGEAPALSVLDAAAWVIASRELARLPEPRGVLVEGPEQRVLQAPPVDPALSARISAMLVSAWDADRGWAAEVPEGARSFVAHALVLEAITAREALTPNAEVAESIRLRAQAEGALRSIFQDTPPARLVGHMPWLGKAELLLNPDGPLPTAAALRDMRDQVWQHQVTYDDAGEDSPDLLGGIVFTSNANPLPTWQTVRPVVFLAQAARDHRLTDQKEALTELSRLLDAARFLRQLSVDDAWSYAIPDGPLWRHGVRSSLWDQRQPVEATALTLMAMTELQQTLESLSR